MGTAPHKAKQMYAKSSQTTSLCYSIVKSTFEVPLTLVKVAKKKKRENSSFVHLLSSLSHITRKLYGICKYYTILNDYSPTGIFLLRFGAVYKLGMVSNSHKTVPRCATHSHVDTSLAYSMFTCFGHDTYSQAISGLLNVCYRLE